MFLSLNVDFHDLLGLLKLLYLSYLSNLLEITYYLDNKHLLLEPSLNCKCKLAHL